MVSSGMNDDVAAALLAVSGAATPSTAPRPKRSGFLDRFFSGRVGDQRGQHRASAGQHAEDEADHRPPPDRPRRLAQVFA